MPQSTLHRSLSTLVAVCIASAALPMIALAQGAVPIADALDETKNYDFVTIEGTITDTKGQDRFRLEDSSGDMIIQVRAHIIREHGALERGDRLQVWGRIEEKKLDHDKRGMVVSRLYRLEATNGAAGADQAGAAASAEITPIDRSQLPAAPSIDPSDVIKPKASEAFVQRVRGELRDYRQAETNVIAVGEAYARVARDTSASDTDEAAALDQLQAAEARVIEIRDRIPALIDSARAEGIDESTIQMIEHEAGIR